MSQYATIAQFFTYGLPATARGNLTDDQINGALTSASGTADSKLRGVYSLPLLAWGSELTKYTCWIAAYELMTGVRGYNPAAGADPGIENRYVYAMTELDKVQRKATFLDVTPSPGQSPTYDQPLVISSSVVDMSGRTASNRGW
jgi:phage gp36-like protein